MQRLVGDRLKKFCVTLIELPEIQPEMALTHSDSINTNFDIKFLLSFYADSNRLALLYLLIKVSKK